jgi:thioredoxin 1
VIAEPYEIAVGLEELPAIIADERRPVLVEFWAPWCGTCRLIAGSLQKLVEERHASVRVATVNIEASPEAADTFAVRSLPTILMFVGGVEKRRITGLMSYSTLVSEIAALPSA